MKLSIKRFFQPLEEWIYLKIYINPISSNLVVNRYILPIVKEIFPTISPKWFFLRYKDSHYHLRLRFWVPNALKIDKVLCIIQSHLKRALEDGYVHRWSIDGYERELERYGIENIEITEEYFCISSTFLANSVWQISSNDYMTNCLVLSMMHISLTNFLPNLDERLNLCENNMRSLYSEFGLSERYIRPLNDMYRRYRKFTDILIAERDENMFNGNINNLLKEYRNQLETLIRKMDNDVYTSINLRSIIHLDVNRAYEIDARRIEMVLYYILYKAYNAEMHRTKALKDSK